MPTLMPTDTAAALGPNAEKCDSRSLLLERFVYDHPTMDEARRLHFSRVCEDSFRFVQATRAKWQKDCHESRNEAERRKLRAYIDDTAALARQTVVAGPAEPRKVFESKRAFLDAVAAEKILHAQLQSRLMVNMAGGVMENAGLCLDRFGLPYIPGSAVKGCTRRAALATLHEWCETGTKPTGPDNPLAACCSAFPTPAEMLASIARVFGWCEQDWSDLRDQSDFLWACGQNHREHWHPAAQTLAARFGWEIAEKHRDTPWKSLPHFAGSVSFLPAYAVDLGKTGKVDGLPLEVPTLGKLELDVVTVHHKHYYAEPAEPKDVPHSDERWQRWKRDHDAWEREWGTAPDIEEPVPNVFPAVAPGHVFAFAIAPLRGADPQLVQHACNWLATGLSVFGLGAKANAGYGWFECSESIYHAVKKILRDRAERERAEKHRQAEEQQRKAEEAERLRQKQERDAALANLSGDERADKEIELLTDQQFDAKLRAFCKEPRRGGPTEEQKKAIVRALRGPRLAYWQAFKTKATKGELATVDQAIRQLSKAMNLGKMP